MSHSNTTKHIERTQSYGMFVVSDACSGACLKIKLALANAKSSWQLIHIKAGKT
jgi:hypothetical protein